MQRKPNLMIIGAMKSGTTSLHSYLAGHPDVFMCTPKEPCYFVDRIQLQEQWPWMAAQGYWASEANYLKLFEEAGDAKIVGESSTLYTKLPQNTGCAKRIHEFDPDMKLLYIMRDPVQRAISHYWHQVRNDNESMDILEAVKQDPQYVDVSHYRMQLEAFLELFPKEQLFTLTFEEMKRDLNGTLTEIFTWLEVDPKIVRIDSSEKRHVTPETVWRTKGFGLLERFRHSFIWDTVGKKCPAPIRRLGRKLAATPIDRKEVDLTEVKNYLRPIQIEQTKALSALLGREFPEWRTLYGKD